MGLRSQIRISQNNYLYLTTKKSESHIMSIIIKLSNYRYRVICHDWFRKMATLLLSFLPTCRKNGSSI